MTRESADAAITKIDDACLRNWRLPMPSDVCDKEDRGRVLVLGGSRQLGGAVVLAGRARRR